MHVNTTYVWSHYFYFYLSIALYYMKATLITQQLIINTRLVFNNKLTFFAFFKFIILEKSCK